MKNENRAELLEANSANVEVTFNKIREYANANGYIIMNALKVPTNLIGLNKSLHFDSKKKKKVLRNYINRLNKRMSHSGANCFLHFLFKTIYKMDTAPSVEFSEKEIKIRSARKAWVKARAEAEKLRALYRTEKGDFYKKK
jgi:hypothetical protein